MMNKTLKQLTAFLAAGIVLCGCGELPGTAAKENTGAEPAQRTLFAMDTVMSLTAYGPGGEEAVQKAAEEIERLDKLLSTGDENSEISNLNRKGSGKLQGDVKELVERSLQMAEETDGTFDIAIYPVMEAWGFTEEEQHVPDKEVLKELGERLYLHPSDGYLPQLRCDQRSGKLRRQCSDSRDKTGRESLEDRH